MCPAKTPKASPESLFIFSLVVYISLAVNMLNIDEVLALDQLTLLEHTERAGDVLDPKQQRERLEKALPVSRVCSVRRNGSLVAYAMMHPESNGRWFVTAFGTHPQWRSAPVLQELFSRFAALAHEVGVTELKSHVYKTNRLSISFHRRLGFRITKENAKGVEFVATMAEVSASRAIKRSFERLGLDFASPNGG